MKVTLRNGKKNNKKNQQYLLSKKRQLENKYNRNKPLTEIEEYQLEFINFMLEYDNNILQNIPDIENIEDIEGIYNMENYLYHNPNEDINNNDIIKRVTNRLAFLQSKQTHTESEIKEIEIIVGVLYEKMDDRESFLEEEEPNQETELKGAYGGMQENKLRINKGISNKEAYKKREREERKKIKRINKSIKYFEEKRRIKNLILREHKVKNDLLDKNTTELLKVYSSQEYKDANKNLRKFDKELFELNKIDKWDEELSEIKELKDIRESFNYILKIVNDKEQIQ